MKRLHWLLVLVLGLTACTVSTPEVSTPEASTPEVEAQAVSKKLIDLSSQIKPPALLANAAAMKNRGYSGVITNLSGSYMEVFVAGDDPERLHESSDFTADYNSLRSIKTQGIMTDNFLRINSAQEASWNWFDDADWALTTKNLRIFARAASIGGYKGIAFDPEPYGLSPWFYEASTYGGRSLQAVSSKVRARGRQFISVIQSELPEARILSLYLTQPILGQWEKYELWKPFFEGMLEGANSTVRFIDGDEPSYYYLEASAFDAAKTTIRGAYSALDPALATKYRQQVQVAHSAFTDGVLNLFNSPRFFGFYLASDAERARLLQHNLYHGLRSADEYVWVYTESPNIYRNDKPYDLPVGLTWAARSASSKIAAGQPLGFSISSFVNRARLGFDRKVGVYGTVNTSADPTFTVYGNVTLSSGFTDKKGNESACIIFNAYGNFECIFPSGWTGRVTPRAAGKTFSPAFRSYSNLTQALGEQDFVMR
jgi:hypothetical protein